MKNINNAYLIYLFLLIGSTLFSQLPITFQTTLNIDDGIKDRTILKVDRDREGNFWLLQTNSIQKYDGSFFSENIKHSVPNAKYFKSVSEKSILLVSEELDVFLLNIKSKELNRINTNASFCKECELFDINLTPDFFYLIYKKGGDYIIFKIILDDTEIGHQSTDTIPQGEIKLTNILITQNGYIGISTDEEVIYKPNQGDIVYFETNPSKRSFVGNAISSFISEKEIYFSLPQKIGTYRFKNGTFSTIDSIEKLSFAKKDKLGNLILGLSKSHLHTESIYLLENDSLKLWRDLSDKLQISTDVYVENIKDKLLFSSHVGLYYFKIRNNGIVPSHMVKEKVSGFGNIIMGISQLPDGRIFYVKENGGAFMYNEGKEPIKINVKPEIDNNNYCFYDDFNKKVWIGGYSDQRNGLLFSYDIITEKIERKILDEPVLYGTLYEKDYLLLSIGTEQIGKILKFNIQENRVEEVILTLKNEKLRKFEFYSDHELLISSSKRLLKFNLETQTIETIYPDAYIQTIVKIDNKWFIGTIGNGLLVMDQDFRLIKQFNETNGLSNNQVYSISKDPNGNFWVGSGFGVNVLSPNLEIFKKFYQEDGISDNEFNSNASILLENNKMLLGTINGLTEFDPLICLSDNSQHFGIESISYDLRGEKFVQTVLGKTITLNAKAENIKLNLFTNDFYNKNKVVDYLPKSIKIEPFHNQIKIQNNNIEIPFLKSKETVISVAKINPSKNLKSIDLSIIRKKDFRNLYILFGIIILVTAASYFITRKIIKYNQFLEEQKRMSEVRMAELELQALRSQMNPHFIFNSLGAILLYLQTNEKKKAEKYLSKFAKLMRMFLESSKSKFISFQQERDLLELYLELEKLRFEDKFEYSFDIDEGIDANNFKLPSMLLQPFVENSINHGIYHKKGSDGKINISAVSNNDKVKVIISDNGIGREKSKEIKDNSLKKHRSRATQIITERIQVLKKEKDIDISIYYEDIELQNGESGGTKVIIEIPKILKTND